MESESFMLNEKAKDQNDRSYERERGRGADLEQYVAYSSSSAVGLSSLSKLDGESCTSG